MSAAVELVTIGDELLLGTTVDTNSAWLGQTFTEAGIRVMRRATVGDDDAAIRAAVREALDRTGTVVCTGGLGPTADDRTRPVIAELFGAELRLDEDVLEAIRDRFRRRGRVMAEINRIQAMVPEGATVLANPRGTAPGLALEDAAGRMAILLPGVPSELRGLTTEHVLPLLTRRLDARAGAIRHRYVRTTGIAESSIAERVNDLLAELEPLAVAFLPSVRGVDLRLSAWGQIPMDEIEARMEAAAARLVDRLVPHVYSGDQRELVDVVSDTLRERGLTLAVAESCTGGMIASRLTDPAGASSFLLGGVVAYANDVKVELLAVPEADLAEHGAVSEPVVRAMATGVRRRLGADAAVAVTGIAGPAGGTEAKPVGTVWVAVALGDEVRAERHALMGDRDEIRQRATQAALALLRTLLEESPEGR